MEGNNWNQQVVQSKTHFVRRRVNKAAKADENQETDQQNSQSGPEGCYVDLGSGNQDSRPKSTWEFQTMIKQQSGSEGVN